MDLEPKPDIDVNKLYKNLYNAIKRGDDKIAYENLEEIAFLSESDRKELFKFRDDKGNTLLHVLPGLGLSYSNAYQIFIKLVALGHPLIVQNNENQTPLHKAININCPKTTVFLIRHAPDLPKRVDTNGQLPMHIAAKNLNEVLLIKQI